jgi:hypothetical protein
MWLSRSSSGKVDFLPEACRNAACPTDDGGLHLGQEDREEQLQSTPLPQQTLGWKGIMRESGVLSANRGG